MAEWGQVRDDLQEGVALLCASIVQFGRRTGREVALFESRRELAHVERQLARLYRELGETAYEQWDHSGELSLKDERLQPRLEEIASLIAELSDRKHEFTETDEGAEAADDESDESRHGLHDPPAPGA